MKNNTVNLTKDFFCAFSSFRMCIFYSLFFVLRGGMIELSFSQFSDVDAI